MYLSTTKSTEFYHIEKNKCAETVFGEGCFDKHCISNNHIWWAVNEIQGEFGEIVYEADSYVDAVRWAQKKYSA